ncbi:hypothetical protein [Pseudoclavibacter helvolus]|uniref:hypothetical protein n=1 Tax=Pseudoclavibacter helvolus TaxID=255205 RepID=UPI003C760625
MDSKTETMAAYTSRLDLQRRKVRARRAAKTLPQVVIDGVESREPGFIWDEAAADAALVASTEIVVDIIRDPDDHGDESIELLRADLVADRGLMESFLTESREQFSGTLYGYIEALVEEAEETVDKSPEAVPLDRQDEELVSLWLLTRVREIKAAQAARDAA